ncbi:MAG: EamA family transporter [Chlorobiota bacterium]|jgi:transporter family protein|nr:EamA family transporter [Chlorobiota bacterium]QQS66876.1 MAG: EamA family transporter [Chlorobiota bacterium]
MEPWLLYSLLAMLFAGLTSILAKVGLKDISSDLGLAIRTGVVFIIVIANSFLLGNVNEIGKLTPKTILFLVISGITTSLSWIFYYRAMKLGKVSYVATIDKGSIVITLMLSFLLLKEPLTLKLISGAILIISGLIVIAS